MGVVLMTFKLALYWYYLIESAGITALNWSL
jgi:hypothetical protein